MSESLPPGDAVHDADELEARWADAWRPERVAETWDGVGAPCVATGWALDLFRGKQPRLHGDLEIAVLAAGFPDSAQLPRVRVYGGVTFYCSAIIGIGPREVHRS
ncbi:hypothetical protein [Streptomyces hokutonensis]|uniref:Uncharacterized protein n=1 Tax=Streptomyces hokutonensis TaxID=1306990 RepID=A0ABW6M5Y9_9ACTN